MDKAPLSKIDMLGITASSLVYRPLHRHAYRHGVNARLHGRNVSDLCGCSCSI